MIGVLLLFFGIFSIFGISSYYRDKSDEKWKRENPNVILPGDEY